MSEESSSGDVQMIDGELQYVPDESTITDQPAAEATGAPAETPVTEDASPPAVDQTVPMERFKGLEKAMTRQANDMSQLKQQNQFLTSALEKFVTARANPSNNGGGEAPALDLQDILSDQTKAIPFLAAVSKQVFENHPAWKQMQDFMAQSGPQTQANTLWREASELAAENKEFVPLIPQMRKIIEALPERSLTYKEAFELAKIASPAGVSGEAVNGRSQTTTPQSTRQGVSADDVLKKVAAASINRGGSPSGTGIPQINNPKDAVLAAMAEHGWK